MALDRDHARASILSLLSILIANDGSLPMRNDPDALATDYTFDHSDYDQLRALDACITAQEYSAAATIFDGFVMSDTRDAFIQYLGPVHTLLEPMLARLRGDHTPKPTPESDRIRRPGQSRAESVRPHHRPVARASEVYSLRHRRSEGFGTCDEALATVWSYVHQCLDRGKLPHLFPTDREHLEQSLARIEDMRNQRGCEGLEGYDHMLDNCDVFLDG